MIDNYNQISTKLNQNDQNYNCISKLNPQEKMHMFFFLQDFVGAWLSEWIYFADPAKPYAIPTMKLLAGWTENSGTVHHGQLWNVNPGYHESSSTFVGLIWKSVVIIVGLGWFLVGFPRLYHESIVVLEDFLRWRLVVNFFGCMICLRMNIMQTLYILSVVCIGYCVSLCVCWFH